MKIIIALFVVAILIVWFLHKRQMYQIYRDYLHGMWIANDAFLDDADIGNMYIYIGDKSGYCMIQDTDGTELYNDDISITIGILFPSRWRVKSSDPDIIPRKLTVECDIKNGTMVLYDSDGHVFASMYKHTEPIKN